MSSIRITRHMFEMIRNELFRHAPKEAACFLLAGVFETDKGVHFTVRELMYPTGSDYDVQEDLSLQVSPVYFNRVISRAERENLAVIMCHSHPFSKQKPKYSWSDNHGESISARTLHDCLSGKPVGSILLGKDTIAARVWKDPGRAPAPVDELRILGRHFAIKYVNNGRKDHGAVDSDVYARQVLAFGEDGQRFLSNLRVGIVGVGGTGSCVAEGLARLGAEDFVLIDKDVMEPSNITRMFGTYRADASGHDPHDKVALIKRNIENIQPSARVVAVRADALSSRALISLKTCDVVFSCVDRHAPRSIINELAYQCFIPVVDIGVGLGAADGRIEGGSVRASIVGPGLPCMYCQGFIRSDIIAAETLPAEERETRRKEGYIPGITEAPSVISFTTMAGGLGMSLFLDLLFDYMNSEVPSFLIELHPPRLGRVATLRLSDCVCLQREGRGDYFPFSTA